MPAMMTHLGNIADEFVDCGKNLSFELINFVR